MCKQCLNHQINRAKIKDGFLFIFLGIKKYSQVKQNMYIFNANLNFLVSNARKICFKIKCFAFDKNELGYVIG